MSRRHSPGPYFLAKTDRIERELRALLDRPLPRPSTTLRPDLCEMLSNGAGLQDVLDAVTPGAAPDTTRDGPPTNAPTLPSPRGPRSPARLPLPAPRPIVCYAYGDPFPLITTRGA